jgi:uncharacterized membrane protein
MDEFIAQVMSPSLLSGIIFIITGAIVYMYPPKNINHLYGYRTKTSMQSQERWDFAQKFSSLLMIKMGAVLIALSLLAAFIPDGEGVKVIGGIALLILSALYLFATTEKALKKKFQN